MPSKRSPGHPPLSIALLAVALLITIVGGGRALYQLPLEVLLITATAAVGAIACVRGQTWREMQDGMVETVSKGLPAMAIVIIVGALIGTWIACGTLPMMVQLGLRLTSPSSFLLMACLTCSAVSLITGTAFGTAGTLGVALMGIAQGLGVPAAPAAGAIVAGSYFGNKLSPLSSSTNLAAATARTTLGNHVRHMLWTTLPPWGIALAVFAFAGIEGTGHATVPAVSLHIQQRLGEVFTFNWLQWAPPLVLVALAALRKPIIPTLLASAGVAALLVVAQGGNLADAAAAITSGYHPATGDAVLDHLLARGGMSRMMHATLVALTAFALGGVMRRSGVLDTLLRAVLSFARSPGLLIASTLAAAVAVAVTTGASFLAILLPAELFADAYGRAGLAARNLSRTVEDGGSAVVPIIPWSIAGVFLSDTLGVRTLDYAPWAIPCFGGVLFALLYAFTGFTIKGVPAVEAGPLVPADAPLE